MFVFLDGLDDRLDKIRGDVLQMNLFPTIEQTYAHIWREATWQQEMTTDDINGTQGAILASKDPTLGPFAKSKLLGPLGLC